MNGSVGLTPHQPSGHPAPQHDLSPATRARGYGDGVTCQGTPGTTCRLLHWSPSRKLMVHFTPKSPSIDCWPSRAAASVNMVCTSIISPQFAFCPCLCTRTSPCRTTGPLAQSIASRSAPKSLAALNVAAQPLKCNVRELGWWAHEAIHLLEGKSNVNAMRSQVFRRVCDATSLAGWDREIIVSLWLQSLQAECRNTIRAVRNLFSNAENPLPLMALLRPAEDIRSARSFPWRLRGLR